MLNEFPTVDAAAERTKVALQPGVVAHGPMLPEPIEVLVMTALGQAVKVKGVGQHTGRMHQCVLQPRQLALLEVLAQAPRYDGDAANFKLGVEAVRLGLAHEYDPHLSIRVADIEPLPHQLEAVYGYFLKMPRVRFLLADDPGAGKTVMAGMLLKELKFRGLVKRVLVVAPANLTFQWQRELSEKFYEHFDIVQSETLRASYGRNPWEERDQVITSVSWISRIDDAKDSLLRSRWDLVIVDEAHKMSARRSDQKTLAFKTGEALSERTDHLLLMTSTPHKGDPENFRLFLSLLDRDVYADVQSLEEAMRRHKAPFYLRRLKESLVSFPDPKTGQVKRLFTERDVRTTQFSLDGSEAKFYEALTDYVEHESVKAASVAHAQANVLGFQMAMLQRRFASSIYAVRRSLERMCARRRSIIANPDMHHREQLLRKLPEDFDDLPESEQSTVLRKAENATLAVDVWSLRQEVHRIDKLVKQALALETREVESKLNALKQVLVEQHIFRDPKMKLLVFTEHKDTLDYLAGDGQRGRPFGKLRQWGLACTEIHGGMDVGDHDTPGTRMWAERQFQGDCQVLVATEAAGEGINLQFCWLLINYDLPWNPIRLEQRMGRIHRYGQRKDCVVFNFAAVNTREGRVLEKLLARLEEIKSELGSDKVFDVVGQMLPANFLGKLFREMYAKRISESAIAARIALDIDPVRVDTVLRSTLEGLASPQVSCFASASGVAQVQASRFAPAVVEAFFLAAASHVGIELTKARDGRGVYRIKSIAGSPPNAAGRVRTLARGWTRIAFDKAQASGGRSVELVTLGHPLFEAVRCDALERVRQDMQRGTVLWDPQTQAPYRLDVFATSIKDGLSTTLRRKYFVVRTDRAGALSVCAPDAFADLCVPPRTTAAPAIFDLPEREAIESYVVDEALGPLLDEATRHRVEQNTMVRKHVEISLHALIERQRLVIAGLEDRHALEEHASFLDGQLRQAEAHLESLQLRLRNRLLELDKEKHCVIGDIEHFGQTWVVPHPGENDANPAALTPDPEIERIAVDTAMAYERKRGWFVQSVELENRGYDLLSRPNPDTNSGAMAQARFIEVKGRASVGQVSLTANELRTAKKLRDNYWLYVIFNCESVPQLHAVRDPAQLGWELGTRVQHYYLAASSILDARSEG